MRKNIFLSYYIIIILLLPKYFIASEESSASSFLYGMLAGIGFTQFYNKWKSRVANIINTNIVTDKTKLPNLFRDYINPPQEVIDLVNQIKNPEKSKQFNLPLPKGILLAGDPGTGKTYLAKAIAGALDCPFFEYSATQFFGTLVGLSSQNISQAFQTVENETLKQKKSVAIMFIDEFDAIGSRTKSSNISGSTQEVVNTFLIEMDGFKDRKVSIIVLAATNYPDSIDPALRRSGRFDKIIYMQYPDEKSRQQLFELQVNKSKIESSIKPLLSNKLAKLTSGFSQADIISIIHEAARKAIEKGINAIDYDCLAQALFAAKEMHYKKQLPSKQNKETIINHYIAQYKLSNILITKFLFLMQNMSLTDIKHVFDFAYRAYTSNPNISLLLWIYRLITLQNNKIQVKRNRDVIEICKTLYGFDIKDGSIGDLKDQKPIDIFKKFEKDYKLSKFPQMQPYQQFLKKYQIISE